MKRNPVFSYTLRSHVRRQQGKQGREIGPSTIGWVATKPNRRCVGRCLPPPSSPIPVCDRLLTANHHLNEDTYAAAACTHHHIITIFTITTTSPSSSPSPPPSHITIIFTITTTITHHYITITTSSPSKRRYVRCGRLSYRRIVRQTLPQSWVICFIIL